MAWFTKEKRWTFFLSVLIGLCTHFLLLAGQMMSPDGLCKSIRYYSEDFDLSIGRFGIRLFERLRANYSIVYLSAILSILFVAVAAVLLVSLLEIRSLTGAVLTGAVLTVSPALVLTMLHQYVSDLYFLSLLFVLIATIALLRCKSGIAGCILSVAFTVLSLSLYQSYLGIEAGLCVIVTVLALLEQEEPVGKIAKKFLREVVTVFSGLVVYFLLMKGVQAATHVSAGAYGGLNTLGFGTIVKSLPASCANAYHAFFQYFFRDSYVYNASWHRNVFFLLFFLCFAALLLWNMVAKKIYRDWKRLLFLIALLLCFPAAVNVIALIVPTTEIYLLSSIQMLLVVPFFFTVAERTRAGNYPILHWGGAAMLLCVITTYFFADIISYQALRQTYALAETTAERILDRMETAPGYDRSLPVAFAGWLNEGNYPQDQSYWAYTIGPLVTGEITHGDYYPNTESIRRFYLQFFDEQLTMADPATFTAIIGSDEFAQMGVFPAENSVRVVNGVVVVKLMDDPWPPY